MKTYNVNIIFGGNIVVSIKAKNEEKAEEKANKLDRDDFVKLFKKYGQLIDFELTEIEETY